MMPFTVNGTPWAIEPERFERLAADLARPDALEAVRPFKVDAGERLGVRDGVGVLYIHGPLVKYPSWQSRARGWADYTTLRRDLQAALDDPKITAILLSVDTPGGEANGCDELAAAIYDARQRKPTAAFVSGMACSAGYWIASAAEKVVVSDAAIVGSIGVAMTVTDRSSADRKRGVSRIEIVSSQSPGKRAPEHFQKLVDDMASVFIAAVARYRNKTTETVTREFGQGGVLIGRHAVRAGMADAIGSFESALADLRKRPTPIFARSIAAARSSEIPARIRIAEPAPPPVPTVGERAKIEAEARAVERAKVRIRAICCSPEGRKNEERAAELALDTVLTVEAAIETLRREAISAGWTKAAEHVNATRKL